MICKFHSNVPWFINLISTAIIYHTLAYIPSPCGSSCLLNVSMDQIDYRTSGKGVLRIDRGPTQATQFTRMWEGNPGPNLCQECYTLSPHLTLPVSLQIATHSVEIHLQPKRVFWTITQTPPNSYIGGTSRMGTCYIHHFNFLFHMFQCYANL